MSRREKKKLLEIGKMVMADHSISVPKRVETLRIFLREFRKESEKIKMEQFQKINGFAADDDQAKRNLIDELVYHYWNRYPKDDDERNEYAHSQENPMMKIGWRPSV